MSKRLYLGRLPSDTRPEDVQKFFDGYGKIIDCRVMSGFGFVEFENNRDAEEIVNTFNGKTFLGQNIIVEFAKENRRRENYDDRGIIEYVSQSDAENAVRILDGRDLRGAPVRVTADDREDVIAMTAVNVVVTTIAATVRALPDVTTTAAITATAMTAVNTATIAVMTAIAMIGVTTVMTAAMTAVGLHAATTSVMLISMELTYLCMPFTYCVFVL
ncbi:hypothetical protein FRC06_000360 [Ceratobasidium sp. 370]|nr:hypothetical protein FRC06_000360 [Ceratobasidium sp. 370]